jgi:ubiquitin-conjugating enzyme (huntingtin interacting protein 2)
MTLRTVLLSVQSLLCSPEPKNPQDAVVAKQFLKDVNLFNVSDFKHDHVT